MMRATRHIGARLRHKAKEILAPLLYRYHPIGLQPHRLYLWAEALTHASKLDGSIVEIGLAQGGTMAWSIAFLQNIGRPKPYFGVDTFSGFVAAQFDADVMAGNGEHHRFAFSAGSINLVRRVLALHDASSGILIQGDICTLSEDALPARIACALVDVDLAVPVEAALDRIWPRLVPGGRILVDDCYENRGDWQAIKGYQAFCRRHGQREAYSGGMGYVAAPETPENDTNYSAMPVLVDVGNDVP
jgi:hypothetical protein